MKDRQRNKKTIPRPQPVLHTKTVDSSSADLQATASTPPPRSTRLYLSLVLIAVNLVVFLPSWRYEFVSYDDPGYVTSNPKVIAGLTWDGFKWALTSGSLAVWQPVIWISFMLNVQLFGSSAGPQHLTNLFLHIVNTLLLFWFLQRFTGRLWSSAFVAALFAIHPLHVEPVAWVSGRKDVLSTLFWMLALWAYAEYSRKPGISRYLLVSVFFILGLMAKPMLVTLPVVLLLLDFWPLGRMTVRGKPQLWFLVLEKLPWTALSAASSAVTFFVQQSGGAVSGSDALPLLTRVANALNSYVWYIGKMLWPARLAAFYPYVQNVPGWWVAVAALGMAGVTILAIRTSQSRPYFLVGWAWYVVALTPVIGLIQAGGQSMGDRYTYIPLIGLFVIVAWGAPDLLGFLPRKEVALTLGAIVVLLSCTVAARAQSAHWRNSIALWEHALTVTTGNYVAHNNMGFLLGDDRSEEAIAHLREALRLKPNYAGAHHDLGLRLTKLGRLDEAIDSYSKAIGFNANFAEAHYDLGSALTARGRLDEAIVHYREAVRLDPYAVAFHNSLGGALTAQRKFDEAADRYAQALRVDPKNADIHNNLGLVFVEQGREDDALQQYSEALRIEPDHPEAHTNLGILLVKLGKTNEALPHFSEAVRLEPTKAAAHKNLGNIFLILGRTDEARAEYSEVLRIDPNDDAAAQALAELTK